ncbi:hypothetical protein GCM10017778_54200 [Streptomyces vinaceus]|nr:hypothetical protein GCM10017778_54200 [Streptomyces vinaceus]
MAVAAVLGRAKSTAVRTAARESRRWGLRIAFLPCGDPPGGAGEVGMEERVRTLLRSIRVLSGSGQQASIRRDIAV